MRLTNAMRKLYKSIEEARDKELIKYIEDKYDSFYNSLKQTYPDYDENYIVSIALAQALLEQFGDTKHIRIGEYIDEPEEIQIVCVPDYGS